LYAGKSDDGTGDFVSFGLRKRRAEFRLDVGSGPGIVVTDPLELDTWHTVRIKREGKDGQCISCIASKILQIFYELSEVF